MNAPPACVDVDKQRLKTHAKEVSAGLAGSFASLKAIFQRWRERRVQYCTIRELQQLSDRTLKDIGLSRSDIVSTVMNNSYREGDRY